MDEGHFNTARNLQEKSFQKLNSHGSHHDSLQSDEDNVDEITHSQQNIQKTSMAARKLEKMKNVH